MASFLIGLALLTGCSSISTRYLQVDQSLMAGDPAQADRIIEQAEDEYGTTSRVLYRMDRGMTLHLAGQYPASSALLEQAETEVADLYTRRVRTETKAFLVNDTLLPYEGEPYEQVMLNVLTALNYAVTGQWSEALVEARRIDQRLNLLTDEAGDKDTYRDDAFARYLTGILYESTGDLNNAFIAYRKAYDRYQASLPWARVKPPPMLRADLLRTSEALGLTQEHEEYKQAFAGATWEPAEKLRSFAQIVVIGYNGRAPHKEDQFIDLPISLDALRLVLMTKGALGRSNQDTRGAETLLYGLSGHVVRVALPKLVPQKTTIAYEEVVVSGAAEAYFAKSELTQDISALAAKNLNDRFGQLMRKAVARGAVKYALAEGVGRGARMAASGQGNQNFGPLIGLLVGGLAHALAIGTEESDKRSWRTLPDEIQIARLWVPAGSYDVRIRPIGRSGRAGRDVRQSITLQAGETRLFTERALP
ncbi:MAG: COG3014 family protein [Nitrospiraceae bacterium]